MPWRGAEYEGELPSLGWQVIDWIEARFSVPDGPRAGEALKLTDEQVIRFVRWYALDNRGRFLYRRGAKRGPKGEGKSPEAALIALASLCGPTRFDGWDGRGEPVGCTLTAPLVQVAAVSEDQTQNTYGWVYELLRESTVVDEEHLDVGLTRVITAGRPGVLEPVTASAGTREGQRLNGDSILDETHLWLPSNGGKRLASVMRRNAAKMGGRTWETTNAFIIGQNSVAEDTDRAAARGAAGVLYETKQAAEPLDLTDEQQIRKGLEEAYGDSLMPRGWVDPDRLIQECNDPGTTDNDKRRFYFNIPVREDTESWLHDRPGAWANNCDPELKLEDCSHIVGAVDMALRHDTTSVLWAGRHPEGRTVVRAKIFTKNERTGKIPFDEIDEHIEARATELEAESIVYDPRFLELMAARLADKGYPMVEFPQSPERMVPACGHAYDQIAGRQVAHDGDPDLAEHVNSAVWKEAERGRRLTKDGKHPNDGCITLVMALWELEHIKEPSRGPNVW